MKTVAYSSPFVPPEWIAAHGLRPWRLIGGDVVPAGTGAAAVGRSLPIPQGVCPYARAMLDDLADARGSLDAAILTTTCDQMRRVGELLPAPAPCRRS